jgi:acyl-CoA dehydrogenase
VTLGSTATSVEAGMAHLAWPFFDDGHRTFARELRAWAAAEIAPLVAHESTDVDADFRKLVQTLGRGGWLRHAVPAPYGVAPARLDVRTICLARETLGQLSGMADFAFAMQGLGTGPISLFGSDALKQRYLPRVVTGDAIAAFAISEPLAGSDVSAMETVARRDGSDYIVDGRKTWISNAGIAEHYVVFARLDGGTGGDGREFVALVVDADNPGLRVSERIVVNAPHPLGTLEFQGCRVPGSALIGEAGKGMRVALGTLDVFRSTVGAAALGFARRALEEATSHSISRHAFGHRLADLQLTQAKLADMATRVDASALLVYRAAWTRDAGAARVTREAAMAKLYSTESAQTVIDDAVQIFGGRGVVVGETVERLYREIRALRIYEGTSEIQKIVIAGQVVAAAEEQQRRA